MIGMRGIEKRIFTGLFKVMQNGGWVNFLLRTSLQAQINAFLKLDWLDSQKPSFSSARQLLDWMDALPSGPRWQVMELEVDGYNTGEENRTYLSRWPGSRRESFRKPNLRSKYDCSTPFMCGGMRNVSMENGSQQREATRIQDTLPEGATLVPIIAASDKTPVTRHTGSLEMHPLFLTIANIDSDIRMKATAYAWQLCRIHADRQV
ncbi:hypothetical protein EDD16DRAFT_1704438 [Pisolithus croceorrhizus]|nr:hypothetical protein EDD16DRAFT_1704438 [Pisolithus croceorrhizus]